MRRQTFVEGGKQPQPMDGQQTEYPGLSSVPRDMQITHWAGQPHQDSEQMGVQL